MKKSLLVPFVIVLTCCLILGYFSPHEASSAPKEKKPIELIFSSWTPPVGLQTEMNKAWMQNVEKHTAGRVRFTYYDGGALGGMKEHYDLAVVGTADIAYFNFASSFGRFPMMDAIQLPFMFSSTNDSSYALWKVYHEFPEIQKETNEVKVLALGTVDPFYIFTTKAAGPVRTLEDLKGKKIRTTGLEGPTIAALGGTPISLVNMAEIYLALERGTLDGLCMSWQGLPSFKFHQVVHYYTVWDGPAIRCLPWGLFMNWNSWKKMPADIQKVMLVDYGVDGPWFAKWNGEQYSKLVQVGKKIAKESGGEIYTLPAGELERWKQKVVSVREKGIQGLESKGLPGRKYINRIFELVKEYNERK
jgi:TRAP-type C4-dicarboxylate transport system substrate-binding protein